MRILSVNVGESRSIAFRHQTVQTGIFKKPANGPVHVTRYGLQGDVRVELREMGLEHSAIYAYPYEHYGYWQREFGKDPFVYGQFGENLTVTGLLERSVRIGDVFRFGSAVLQVAHPRIPCAKLNERMGFSFAAIFLASCKVGFYLRVLSEGEVSAGDEIVLIDSDENSPTMEEFIRVSQYEFWDAEGLRHLLRARDLMPAWRETIEAKLERTLNARGGWQGLREFEVVEKQAGENGVALMSLKCVKRRTLPAFHGGQQLVVAQGGRGASQRRSAFPLTGNPQDLSAYRIVFQCAEVSLSDEVSCYMASLREGDRILCAAPFGKFREEKFQSERVPVLLAHGIGLAAMVSVLFELEGQECRNAILFYQPDGGIPPRISEELDDLLGRNPGYRKVMLEAGMVDVGLVEVQIPLAQADIHLAGSRVFLDDWIAALTVSGNIESEIISLAVRK